MVRRRTLDRGSDRGSSRGEPRFSRPSEPAPSRSVDSGRGQPSGPPPGYQPMVLPGESISKYQRLAQQPAAQEPSAPRAIAAVTPQASEPVTPLSASFPEDEPIFAANESVAEPLHEEHEDIQATQEDHSEHLESASTTTEWNQEFRRAEAASSAFSRMARRVERDGGSRAG